MLKETLLSTLDELERNFNTLSEIGLKKTAKMQNISHNDLDQTIKMQNQLQDDLKQIAKMRRIKNYQRMSKEELIILS